MILHPAVIALLASSVLVTGLVLYAAWLGGRILVQWNIKSGSELQLFLERKTYLISTILTYVLGFQLISLFLYIFTADHLHGLFVGAMCAAGTLNVNSFGYPALVLKMVTFVFAGLWLILNYADNRAYDYPLIKTKYALLLVLTPLILAETVVQGGYLLSLEPNVITSCCGSLFTSDANGVSSEIASLPSRPAKLAFYSSVAVTAVVGFLFLVKQRGGYAFALLSLLAFFVSVASLISFVSLYFYEIPTHHCPFDILHREYGYVGYPVYVALLGSVVTGLGVGMLMPFRMTESLKKTVPSIQKKLAVLSIFLLGLYVSIATYQMLVSDLILEGL